MSNPNNSQDCPDKVSAEKTIDTSVVADTNENIEATTAKQSVGSDEKIVAVDPSIAIDEKTASVEPSVGIDEKSAIVEPSVGIDEKSAIVEPSDGTDEKDTKVGPDVGHNEKATAVAASGGMDQNASDYRPSGIIENVANVEPAAENCEKPVRVFKYLASRSSPRHDSSSFAGIIGEEMSPAIKTFNHTTQEKIPMNAIDDATLDSNWNHFYMDQSVDELLKFAGMVERTGDLERIFAALKSKLPEEASESDSGLTDKRVNLIETLIQRIAAETNVEARFPLLRILMQLLYRFINEYEILCSNDLKLSETIDHVFDIHLKITQENPLIVEEFQILMDISEWIERALAKIRAPPV